MAYLSEEAGLPLLVRAIVWGALRIREGVYQEVLNVGTFKSQNQRLLHVLVTYMTIN